MLLTNFNMVQKTMCFCENLKNASFANLSGSKVNQLQLL